jgi:hypothetical protein
VTRGANITWPLSLSLALGVTQLAAPAAVRAFSDPLAFSDDVALGGGGGRFFTGSAADGYGCDVCHTGKAGPELYVLGLPIAGYRPGGSYEVRVEWPADLERLALALEITDSFGRAAGTIELPPPEELPNEERCEPVEDGIAAGGLTALGDGRTILNVPDCGAKRVRFLWTAPLSAPGTLRLSGGLVSSDGEADAEGDQTTMFAHVLGPERGERALASDIRTMCSTARVADAGRLPPLAWLLLALSCSRIRRRSRRARR